MTSPDGAWHAGIGDPTPIGWLTVAAYLAAAWECWKVSEAARSPRDGVNTARYWLLVAVALGMLGINKQLDLQSAMTDIGRRLASAGGWYEQRHEVQQLFVIGIGLAGATAVTVLGWLSWPLSPGRAITLAGLAFLASFVLIRAASFHHVDLFLSQTALGLRWNWILELSGIGFAGAGAIVESRAGWH